VSDGGSVMPVWLSRGFCAGVSGFSGGGWCALSDRFPFPRWVVSVGERTVGGLFSAVFNRQGSELCCAGPAFVVSRPRQLSWVFSPWGYRAVCGRLVVIRPSDCILWFYRVAD